MTTIDSAFLTHVTNVLADTEKGLSGSEICKHCSEYASRYGISIPYPNTDIKNFPKKSVVLRKNLEKFSIEQQVIIIRDFCNLEKIRTSQDVQLILLTLITQYADYIPNEIEANLSMARDSVEDWLSDYPLAKEEYDKAVIKMKSASYNRDLLNNLRLSLENLVNYIFITTNRSLENQDKLFGRLLKDMGVKTEIITLFNNVMKFYTDFNNHYVKHNKQLDPNVLELNAIEIEFLFNQTIVLMQILIRLDKEQKIAKKDNKASKLEIV